MKIIVTGGAGFIGGNFVHYMLDRHPEDEIICVDCLTYAGNMETLASVMDNPKFQFEKLDITDREGIYGLFEREHPDIVVNFAAESHVDRSIENPEVFLKTNILGTQVLLDACRKYGIKRYHQVSTDEVYGDLPLDRPELFFTEETPIHTSTHIRHPRRVRICWYRRMAGPIRCRSVFQDVQITMDHIIFRKNSYH